MKKFWHTKNVMLLMGFALLVAMPFLIIIKQPFQTQTDSPLNPYPEPEDLAASYIHKASDNYFYREFSKGADNYHKAIAIYEERKDMHRVATTYNSLADLYVWAGKPDEAEKNYLLAARHYADIEDLLGQADSLKELADYKMKMENIEEAEKWYSQSLSLLKNSKPNRVKGSIHEGMGHMYWKADRIPQAIDSFTRAQATFSALNYRLGVEHMTSVLDRLKRMPSTRHQQALPGVPAPGDNAAY